jgi:hypothetical protein
VNGKRVTEGVIRTANIPLNPNGDYQNGGRSGYRSTENLFVALYTGSRFGQAFWYYLRAAHVVDVYAIVRGRSIHVGWLGPDGFLPGDTLPTHRFLGELGSYTEFAYHQPLIAFPRDVYRIDFHKREIRHVFAAPAGEEVLGAVSSGDSIATAKYPPSAQFDAIATTKHIYVQSFDGTPQLVLPRDPAAAQYGALRIIRPVFAADSSIFAVYEARGGTLPREARDTARSQISKFSANGELIAHASLVGEIVKPHILRIQWFQIPLVGLAEGAGFHFVLAWQATREDPPRNLEHGTALILGWCAAILGSLVSALLIAFIAQRYAFESRRRNAWIAGGLLAGPLAAALLLSLPDWPARVACPSCMKKRVVTRERCEHCSAPFAPPPRDGTEIFDSGLAAS